MKREQDFYYFLFLMNNNIDYYNFNREIIKNEEEKDFSIFWVQ